MTQEAVFFILAAVLGVNGHFYTNSNTDPSSKTRCKDDTCLAMEGPCFIPREKGILTRLDGVKVGSALFLFLNLPFVSKLFSTYIKVNCWVLSLDRPESLSKTKLS